jgi:hypothetical protein
MAQSSTFTVGETFASRSRTGFGSLDFLATATGELCLADFDAPAMTSARGPARSVARSKLEKRHLKRHAAALKQCLNQHITAIKQKAEGALSSLFLAIINHQPTYVLDLLEDDSSHNSTKEPDSDAAKAVGRACFVATPPEKENGRVTRNPQPRRGVPTPVPGVDPRPRS